MRVLRMRRQRRLDAYRRGQRPVDHRPSEDERLKSEQRWDDAKHDVPPR
jgi:hypothetical protein